MTHKHIIKTWLGFVSVVLVICIMAACAPKKVNLWGDIKTGLILKYQMPENQVLKYQTSIKQTQNLEVMGRSIDTETNGKTLFSVRSKGLKEKNHQLGITIDSMSINITSPQGELNPDTSPVIGKSFDMILSPLGKELDLSGAESIQYSLGQAEKHSIDSDFQAIFPDLAEKPVTIGDTWTSKDKITEKSSMTVIHINLESLNTLEGFETVDGMECIKVKAAVTGTLDGEGEQEGMNLTVKGDIKGADTWYFAYKKGFFVKVITKVFSDATITATGARNMTIPMKQEIKVEVNLVK